MREIEVLEQLSYIIEAIAEGATSEARRETPVLLEKLEEDGALSPDVRAMLLERVRGAVSALGSRGDDLAKTAAWLSGASRQLWKRQLRG